MREIHAFKIYCILLETLLSSVAIEILHCLCSSFTANFPVTLHVSPKFGICSDLVYCLRNKVYVCVGGFLFCLVFFGSFTSRSTLTCFSCFRARLECL